MNDTLRVLGLAGSLRRESRNAALLRQAVELAPEGMTIEPFDSLGEIPLYNDDVYQAGFPEPVQRLRAAIAAADGLLFVTPEYNHSIPGVFKNAIDWVSRPPEQPFDGKPGALMSASPSLMGGTRSQAHLRLVLTALNVHLLASPQIMVGQVGQKMDEAGRLTDTATRDRVTAQLAALADWIRRLRG